MSELIDRGAVLVWLRESALWWEENPSASNGAETKAHEDAARFVESIPAAQQWISVEDRLPPVGTVVLCYTDHRMVLGEREDGHESWMTSDGWGEPTHWQPLPEPPK